MEVVSGALAWANYLMAWTWLIWFGAAVLIGGTMLALDEWRLHRTRPKQEDVRAYADDLEHRHGREAFRINGEAMYEARVAKDFQRHRFLKEVSGELLRRLVEQTPLGNGLLPSTAATDPGSVGILGPAQTSPLHRGQNTGTIHPEPQGGGSA